MSIIRQGSLFDLQELYDLGPTQRYDAILSAINTDSILYKVSKKSWLGAPTELNYRAMINSLFIRIIERIPTVKHLIKRLDEDFIFKLNCGFLVSDTTPSEAAYSRMVTKLNDSPILEEAKETVVLQAISEGFITDDAVAVDATHFEARDQAPPKEERPEKAPKKCGRKTKAEREQWLIEKAEREANLPLFEKKIEAQLDVPLAELLTSVPLDPQWGVKKNSEGKNVFWYGDKAHLAVGTKSQIHFTIPLFIGKFK
ncbi:transposase [Scopulibacillus darangshiensis]|uniref:Transposase n=1 Tax=Scopulibacillus darangshiensis TaxID=442528 RepID=A0A4V2SM19_9BACL|nr:transposase [Scopulibacillus darangshiensis]